MTKRNIQDNRNATPWLKTLLIGLAGAVLVGIISLAFLWPTKTAEPRNVPIAITGNNAQQVAVIKQGIEANADGKIVLVSVGDRDEAIRKIQHREAYGAIILSASPEVLTASANGVAVNAIAANLAPMLQVSINAVAQTNAPAGVTLPTITVKTTDVVPAYSASFDIAQLAMPIVFGGIAGAFLVLVLTHGRWRRLVALCAYVMLASLTMFLILHTWFNVLPNDFWPIVGAFALGIFATSGFVVGAYTLFGMRGAAIAAVFTMLIANPMAGIAIPASFMPWIWGDIGQLFTIGAAGTLLRGAVYFPVSQVVLAPIVTLSVWSVIAVAAMLSRDRESLGR